MVIKDGVDQVNLQAGVVTGIIRNFMFDEVPGEPHDLVVSPVLVRLVPGEQPTALVEHRFLPGQLSVDVFLTPCGRGPSEMQSDRDPQNGAQDVWKSLSGHTHLLRSEEHTSELQSRLHLVCRLLLEKKKRDNQNQ